MLPSNPAARRHWMGKTIRVEDNSHSLSGRTGTVVNLNPDKELILVKFNCPNNTSVSYWFKSGQIGITMAVCNQRQEKSYSGRRRTR